ncbi:MAG: DNA methyltransferase [Acidobacteriota bacterium]|nr:DNA methyltransferase [Acidobacteriota bacterium]
MTAPNLRELVDGGYAKVGAHDRKNDRWTLLYLGRGQRQRIERGELTVVGRDKGGALEVVENEVSVPLQAVKTVWNRQSHNAGEYGSRLNLRLLPERRFPFPKSLYAVEDALRIAVKDKPDAVVLDFFSGSGTTAHAVMRLNKQDGGRRQCIMVTNNEVSADEQNKLRRKGLRPGDPEWEQWGICDYITKPRVTAAITGNTPEGDPIKGDYKFIDDFPMKDGFEENAAFFTLTYEFPLAVRHHRAFERIAPMLWMRAGSQGKIITSLGQKGWDISEVYGVLEDFNHSADFFNALEQSETVRTVFFITDDDAAFQMACRKLPDSVKPVRLYSSYLENFEINRGRA